MTKILLVAEGKHEHGDNSQNSALETLIRRVLGNPPGLQFEHHKPKDLNRRVQGLKYRKREVGPHGMTKRIIRWLEYAKGNGFDALIFLCDEDGKRDRRGAIDVAQASQRYATPRACGLAIRTFDAWMLADETAIGQALGETVDRQPDPEKLPSAKADFRQLHDGCACEERTRDVYAGIAGHVDLDELARRCPCGFAPFAERIGELRDGLANTANP